MDIKFAVVVKCRLQADESFCSKKENKRPKSRSLFQSLTCFGARMENKSHQLGVVSWEVFNDLYENQYDLIRKIRFFVQAGKVDQNESLALQMVGDLLAQKQDELEKVRRKGLAERALFAAKSDLPHFQLLTAGNSDGGNQLIIPAENQSRRRGSVWNWVKQFIRAGEQRP